MKGWICYPLWGLKLADNGFGLDKPIFGDATIVTPSFVAKHGPTDPTGAAMLSGAGLSDVLDATSSDSVGPAPTSNFVEVPPHSFIAVRRSHPEVAAKYAQSIRSLLTASCVLSSGHIKGFSLSPLALHWATIPTQVRLDANDNLQAEYKVIVNNAIHLTPVGVTHKALRDSWENGLPVIGTWKLHREDTLSKVFVGDWNSLSPLRKRLRSAASTLARAMEFTDPTVSTLHAVVSVEMLLKEGGTGFRELEELATCAFDGQNGPPEIGRLFSQRHKIAHEAATRDDHEQHAQELSAVWMLLLLAAHVSDSVSSVEGLLRHLRGRIRARQTAEDLCELGYSELAQQVRHAATMLIPRDRKGP